MTTYGDFSSLDKAIRHALWSDPEAWTIGDYDRSLTHLDGLRLIKPVTTNRWSMIRPIGYIKLSWWTHFTINAMVHGERLIRPLVG